MSIAKELETYINDIKEESHFSRSNITVEHRSNNPKRDFLFVNRTQCKHIPSSAAAMINMCTQLAGIICDSLPTNYKVLVVAFAETATAIGNVIADALPQCKMVLQTTREPMLGCHELFEFNEEHSHAVKQFLYVKEPIDLTCFDYVLLIDDEVTTGKTACNFVDQFNELLKRINRRIHFGIASICNWQSTRDQIELAERHIDMFALLTGTIRDSAQKMKVSAPTDYLTLNLEYNERLEHKPNQDLSQIYLAVDSLNLCGESIRVIGTEEFMYVPIKVAEYLETKQFNVMCHSTTRSPIDVISEDAADLNFKLCLPSVYDSSRLTYLYNVREHTDIAILITDGLDLTGALSVLSTSLHCDKLIVIHLRSNHEFSENIIQR